MNASNIATGHNSLAWDSSCGVPEQQVQYSLDYETGHLRTSSSVVYTPSNTNENRTDHIENGNDTGKNQFEFENFSFQAKFE